MQISKSMQAMPGAHVRKIACGQLCCASASAISLHLHHEAMSTFCTRGNEHSLGLGTTNHFNSFMAHKVLAAQLFSELKLFFPQNSVTIFFSHFDFYRPESYAPVSQSYVEKSSQTNPKIDALRHAATRSLFERRDTIVIATVSCI